MRLKLEPTNLQNSKKKLVLVAVLGLVFIVVLFSSFRSSSSPRDSQPPAESVPVAISPDASPTNLPSSDNATSINRASLADDSPKVVEPITKAVLPKIDLDRIVSRNPFIDSAKLDSALQSTSERGGPKNSKGLDGVDPTVQPNSDEQPKVDAVVTGGRRPAALINDKLYFENDTVDGVWVIEQILPKEVIFKPLGFSSQIQQPEKST